MKPEVVAETSLRSIQDSAPEIADLLEMVPDPNVFQKTRPDLWTELSDRKFHPNHPKYSRNDRRDRRVLVRESEVIVED
jgi:hypothetical protein